MMNNHLKIEEGELLPFLHFLDAHNTLTLATNAADGQPHACALFYAVGAAPDPLTGPTLYFLSDPKTLHAQHVGSGAAVAATIQHDGQAWREISGLQLKGLASPCPDNEIARARDAYAARFPFVATAGRLAAALERVRYYKLVPTWMRLIDNSQGFGHKEEWWGREVRSL